MKLKGGKYKGVEIKYINNLQYLYWILRHELISSKQRKEIVEKIYFIKARREENKDFYNPESNQYPDKLKKGVVICPSGQLELVNRVKYEYNKETNQ